MQPSEVDYTKYSSETSPVYAEVERMFKVTGEAARKFYYSGLPVIEDNMKNQAALHRKAVERRKKRKKGGKK